jgi:hypothetical protein
MITAFVAVVIVVTAGFRTFLKWRRRVIAESPTHEDLARKAAEIDARYRRAHPEIDEDFSGLEPPQK